MTKPGPWLNRDDMTRLQVVFVLKCMTGTFAFGADFPCNILA